MTPFTCIWLHNVKQVIKMHEPSSTCKTSLQRLKRTLGYSPDAMSRSAHCLAYIDIGSFVINGNTIITYIQWIQDNRIKKYADKSHTGNEWQERKEKTMCQSTSPYGEFVEAHILTSWKVHPNCVWAFIRGPESKPPKSSSFTVPKVGMKKCTVHKMEIFQSNIVAW